MYVRLAFAVAVHVDPDILLVDEVLAVGDEPFQAKCMQRIRRFQREGRTIVFVSHAPAQVADLCDRAILLQNGRIVADDVPEVSLATLQDFYQPALDSARQASAARSPHAAGLSAVHVSDASGQELIDGATISPGDGIRLDCVIDFPGAVPGWAFRVSIEDGMGNPYTVIDSREHLGKTLPSESGTQRFTLAVPELWVGAGEYHVSLHVRDADDLAISEASRAGSFSVKGLKLSDGPVYTAARIELH
jgi:ABC-2 type transport system ATP-binding protein